MREFCSYLLSGNKYNLAYGFLGRPSHLGNSPVAHINVTTNCNDCMSYHSLTCKRPLIGATIPGLMACITCKSDDVQAIVSWRYYVISVSSEAVVFW